MRNGKVIVIILVCLIILFRGTAFFFSHKEKPFDAIIQLDENQFDSMLFTQDYANIGEDNYLNPFMTTNVDAAKDLVDFLSQYTVKKHWRSKNHQTNSKLIAHFTIYHTKSHPASLFIYEDFLLTSIGNWTSYAILDGPIDQGWIEEWKQTYFP